MSANVNLAPLAKLQFNQNGVPLSGGLLFTYAAGTMNKQATYTDSTGVTPNTNPIVLDANGQCGCWMQQGVAYKMILSPANDTDPPTNPFWTVDNVYAINDQLSAYGLDLGVANAYATNLNQTPATLTPELGIFLDNIVATNTGPSTLNVNGTGALPIQSAGGVALQGGELVAGYGASLRLNYAKTAWILIQTTGGSLPVKAGTKTEHAANLGQIQAGSANYAVDTGTTANAYVVTLTPAIPATIPDGFPLTMYVAYSRSNTAPPTINGITVTDRNGNAPLPYQVRGICNFEYSTAATAFIFQGARETSTILDFGALPSASAATNDAAFSAATTAGNPTYVPPGTYQKTTFVSTPLFYGPGIIDVSGILQNLSPTQVLPAPPVNLAPNSQAEIISYSAGGARMNIAGTGTIAPFTITATTTGSTQTVLTVSGSIGDTKVGDFGSMSGSGVDASLTICPMRILAIGSGTITVQLPNNRSPSTSTSGTFTTQNIGMSASVGDGDAADGWTKATTLTFWREDNSVNLLPNGLYAFGVQKGATSQEALYLEWPYGHSQPSLGEMPLGKTISFGASVYQKVKGSTGTWAPFISYTVAGTTTTINGPSGTSTTGYQWAEVSASIPSNATQVLCGVGFNGTTGDTYYMANPVYTHGNFIGPFNYQKPRNEWLVPFISTAPLSYRGSTVSFPSTADSYNSYSCVFDAHAETFGSIAKSVRAMNMAIEGVNGNTVITSSTAGRFFGLRDVTASPVGAGTHYSPLMRQQVQAVASEVGGIYYLDGNGNAVAYSAVAGDGWNLLSMDIASYLLS